MFIKKIKDKKIFFKFKKLKISLIMTKLFWMTLTNAMPLTQ